MEMDERNFVFMHKGVLDAVISQGSFKEIIGKLKLSTLVKKQVQVQEDVDEEMIEEGLDQPTTSEEKTGAKPKVKTRARGKARGKGTGKGRGKGQVQKPSAIDIVPPVQVVS